VLEFVAIGQDSLCFTEGFGSENILLRTAGKGHGIFAVMTIVLGAVGSIRPDLVSLWSPISRNIPGQAWLVHVMALVALVTGIGLLFERTQATAARSLLAALLFWLLVLRLPYFFFDPLFAACWSVFPLLLMIAAAWTIYVGFADSGDKKHFSLMLGNNGLRIARCLYGACLIFFGIAHFVDVKDTIALVPYWLPDHLFWAYFTGSAFVAAGLSILAGVCDRLAVTLAAVQLALFLFLVWIPAIARRPDDPFRWSEAILNAALCAGAWVMADSYHRAHWLTFRNN
jgi:uncharacterized membrane protein